MLWDSIKLGLEGLTVFDFYIATIIYSVMVWVPVAIFSSIIGKIPGLGRVLSFIFQPLLVSVATLVFVLSTLGILLGMTDDAMWEFPWTLLVAEPWFFIKTAGLMLIVWFVLAFIPVIGSFSSFATFVQAVVAIMIVLPAINLFPVDHVQFIPDLMTSIGFIILSAFIGWLAFMIVMLPLAYMDKEESGWAMSLGLAVSSTPGLIAILFYGAYIAQQL